MPPALLLLFGLVALIAGAEFVVRCGSRLARRVGIPPIVVGLTVVSLGTSAPELAVGIDAIRSGAGSLAVGNIAGTNIVNLLLILGLSAVIRPIALGLQILKLDLPAMALASVLLLLLALDGTLSVFDGALLFGLAIVYSVLLLWTVRRENARVLAEFAESSPKSRARADRGRCSCSWPDCWAASSSSCSALTGWCAAPSTSRSRRGSPMRSSA